MSVRRARASGGRGGDTGGRAVSPGVASAPTTVTTTGAACGAEPTRSNDVVARSAGTAAMAQQSAIGTAGAGATTRGASGVAASPAPWCMPAQSAGMAAAAAAADAGPSGMGHATAHAAATTGDAVSSRTTAAAIARRTFSV